ncbi:hypothetical protein E6W39_19115 [Kitasatospora acidiphila]|uniref:Uncharacterized protein n=1 Tax=Kitasatospora acidiphila TaxID=2567942 RepID=A0A540W4P7_9ACTN|nr:hypothetical protein [Kitasatospora acidiphila]TQF03962.1 hypothetical protein E6W39_19115 [Kitasatospora acidiphila]
MIFITPIMQGAFRLRGIGVTPSQRGHVGSMTEDQRVTMGEIAREHAGPEAGATIVYDNSPWGRLIVVRYMHATCYWLMTSEHTEAEDLTEMLALVPDEVSFERSEGAPNGFGHQARKCVIHYLWTYQKGVPVARTEKTKVVLSAEILG